MDPMKGNRMKFGRINPGGFLPKALLSIGKKENGTILIGIIIALVLVGVLAAVMTSLYTTTTMSELKVNQMSRAYYIAESGLWYTFARLRNDFNDPPGYYYPAGGYPDDSGVSISLPNNESFNVKTMPLFNEGEIDPYRLRLVSRGTVGSGSHEANREVVFDITKPHEGFSKENIFELKDDLSDFTIDPGIKKNEAVLQMMGKVTEFQTAVSVNLPNGYESVRLSIKWCNLPSLDLTKAWNKQKYLLSYEMQVKVKTLKQLHHYMIGLSFRVQNAGVETPEPYYGVSFFYSETEKKAKDYPSWLGEPPAVPPDPMTLGGLDKDSVYLVFWKFDSGDFHLLSSQKLTSATHGSVIESDGTLKDWSTLIVRVQEDCTPVGSAFPPCGSRTNTISILAKGISDPGYELQSISWPSDYTSPDISDADNSVTTANLVDGSGIPTTPIDSSGRYEYPCTRPEFGAHAYASSGADAKIFLDDLAIKIDGIDQTDFTYVQY